MVGGSDFWRRLVIVAAVLCGCTNFAHAMGGIDRWIITIVKTPSSPTYSSAGQVIGYTYVVSSSAGSTSTVTSVALNDDKVPAVSCPSTSLAPGAQMTCTGSYTITPADLTAGSVTNTVNLTGTANSPACGCDVAVTSPSFQATITFAAPPAGSITIVKTASGGNNSFNFTSTIPGAASFSLVTVGGSASRTFANLTPGTYTVAEVNLPQDWKLATLTCTGDAGGTPTTVSLSGRSASIGLDGGEAIVCTFGNVFDDAQHRQETLGIIGSFLSHRIELLASHDPDRIHFWRRVPEALWNGGGTQARDQSSMAPFRLSGASGDLSSQLVFATSLRQLALADEAAKPNNPLRGVAGPGRADDRARPFAPAPPFDLWIEAHFSKYDSELSGVHNKGSFGLLYVGADYLVSHSLLVGALAQFDSTAESSRVLNSAVDGRGVMVGPYLSAQLSQHLFFDARGAWGVSANRVNPFGSYTDSFSTDRWLARANLTGNWTFGNFRITPSASVTSVGESQHAYTDSLAVLIPGQTVSLGRFTFGPELAYRIVGTRGVIYEPQVALTGVWDFQKPNVVSIGDILISQDDVHVKAQAGLAVRSPNGMSVRLLGSYDGVGSSNFRDIGGQVWLSIPWQ